MDEPDEEKPVLKMAGIRHAGCVNRVKYNCIGLLFSMFQRLFIVVYYRTLPTCSWNVASHCGKFCHFLYVKNCMLGNWPGYFLKGGGAKMFQYWYILGLVPPMRFF